MIQDTTALSILAFAHHLDDPKTPAEIKARSRGWLTEADEVTGEGRTLVQALAQQQGTRTLFRAFA